VRARAAGVFVVPQMADMPGRYFREGDLFGYVIGDAEKLARVVVPQDAIDRVRIATDRVLVRRADRPEEAMAGRIVRAIPGGEEFLPSRALATEGGGEIATDPRETRGAKALQRMFQFDVAIDDSAPVSQFGQRVYVRFEHDEEPLGIQWLRSVRLLFLSRFSV
jgi:putative peptide zinc metalloprotease protein